MPLSHKYHTIFFHIPKTAGSSIETLLDIRFNRATIHDNLLNHSNTGPDSPAFQHFLPAKIKQLLDADGRSNVWDSYRKFTVVRNPLERAVSSYVFLKRQNRFPQHTKTFPDFLRFAVKVIDENENCDEKYDSIPYLHHLRPQQHWFRPENMVYDRVLRFETLEQDVTKMCEFVKCPHRKLPRINMSSDRRGALETYYTDREVVMLFDKAYGKDMNIGDFQYEYPSSIHKLLTDTCIDGDTF
jgi:hypothetical protein